MNLTPLSPVPQDNTPWTPEDHSPREAADRRITRLLLVVSTALILLPLLMR